MNLLVEVRIASPDLRSSFHCPVAVEATDGGDAQRKALDIAQTEYPAMRVSGGAVYNDTADARADMANRFGHKVLENVKPIKKARKVQQMGVRAHPLDKEADPVAEATAVKEDNDG